MPRRDGEKMLKVGLFGGTFDPIHNGHLEMARRALHVFGLDRVWFIPCRIPPHKDAAGVTDPFHRYAMVALATGEEPRFAASAMELRTEGTSYTIRTVSRFKEQFGGSAELYFLMGMDSWREIGTWKDYRRLLESCNLILLPRDGEGEIPDHGVEVVDVQDPGSDRPDPLPAGPAVFRLVTGEVTVSATGIREKAMNGGSLTGFIPESVDRYLKKYNLYRNIIGAGL